MVQEHVAMCPGSFDPVTLGHLHVIERATRLFGRVIVSVAEDTEKEPLFSVEERVEMLREACADLDNVEVDSFAGLVVEHARKRGAVTLVKGLRAVSDFEAEFQMTLTNRRLARDIETTFVITDAEYAFLSSSVVNEVARLGGDVSAWVPQPVVQRLREKFGPA
ncbi:MAG: pantetheine-phosphate adenylyltransferase [Armatimonadota bacterium]